MCLRSWSRLDLIRIEDLKVVAKLPEVEGEVIRLDLEEVHKDAEVIELE